MLNNMAKDTATFLVTGDKGKAPMFQTNFGEYLKNEGDAFLGDAFNNQFQKEWGASLCEPLNPVMKVNIQLTAKNNDRAKAELYFLVRCERIYHR